MLFLRFSFSTAHLPETPKAPEPSTHECWLQWGHSGSCATFRASLCDLSKNIPEQLNKISKSAFQSVSPAYLATLISLFLLVRKYPLLRRKEASSYYLASSDDWKTHFYISQKQVQTKVDAELPTQMKLEVMLMTAFCVVCKYNKIILNIPSFFLPASNKINGAC